MGRPRAFDPDTALAAAQSVFLRLGYEGATLEDLTRAMGINKPSLYAAFGNKAALYAQVLQRYGAAAQAAMLAALGQAASLQDAVQGFLAGAIRVYAPPGGERLGCLIASTAGTAAGADPAIRAALQAFLTEADAQVAALLQSRFGDELQSACITPLAMARLLNGAAHSLSLRARSGTDQAALQEIAAAFAASLLAHRAN